jgi:3-oxoacyl-[acyl-carrier-protein] synthase-3
MDCSVLYGIGGGALPKDILSNQALAERFHLETSDEWIVTRTGIQQRYLVAPHEHTSDLAIQAAKMALLNASLDPEDLDFILLATSTPDHRFPPTAVLVQEAIGAKKALSFDMNAACSGFLFAVSMADSYLRGQNKRFALIIGADTLSRMIDWSDRTTAVLFGDGAGAILLKREACSEPKRGLLHTCTFFSRGYEHLYISENHNTCAIKMDGREVFRQAVSGLEKITRQLMLETHISTEDIHWIIPHQANKRILETVAHKLNIPFSKILYTGDQHANTSAASIPLALWEGWKKGLLKEGQLVVLQAFGAGFTGGASLLRL